MSHAQARSVGDLTVALAHTSRLLARDPRLAEAQADEILKVVPGQPEARRLLGAARRLRGDLDGARAELEPLARATPDRADVFYELGLTLAGLDDSEGAVAALRRALRLEPVMNAAWRALGDLLMLAGDQDGADQAYARHIQTSTRDPGLMEAAAALCSRDLPVAERLLKARLKLHPTDVAAIRMLAEVATRLGRYADAEALLTRCLELAPSFTPARHMHAVVLFRQNKAAQALPEIDRLLADEPANPAFRSLQAAALGLAGDYGLAIDIYQAELDERPNQPKLWLSYGHALKTAGRQANAIAAYRQALTLAPSLGEAYWSLANLKTVRLTVADVAAMQAQLDRDELGDDDRLHLSYALGKALEDAGDYAPAFTRYAEGARIRRAQIGYDAGEIQDLVGRLSGFFTAERLAAPADWPVGPTPIFVVGLPRSGSTLVEQILASHSAVEGTMELSEIVSIAKDLGRGRREGVSYPEVLAGLQPEALRALGQRYLDNTAIHRKTDKPLFIDKLPNNWLHVGLIQLILPQAKIIDARRHPMAACFSAFKQHFARGQHFSYRLEDVASYYRGYVELMTHFDRVMPGRIHRVIYEDLVENTQAEVRRLLHACELPFEPACLKFYENDRAVRTASSEQVRQPIFRDGLDQWRKFEPWLEPLKITLGPVLDAYRGGQADLNGAVAATR